MRTSALVIVLLLSACEGADANPSSAAIVGGDPSGHEDVVAIVARSSVRTYDCTGVVVGEYAVLTARHCVTVDEAAHQRLTPEQLTIVVGPARSRFLQQVPVAELVVGGGESGDYVGDGRDIAMLIAEWPLGLPVAEVAEVESDPGATVTMVGYGDREGMTQSGERFEGTATVDEVYPYLVEENRNGGWLTTSGGPAAACPGDSGGPVYADDRLVGIIAAGADCVATGRNVHTNVVANRGLIARGLARIPGCEREDQSGGCGVVEATLDFEVADGSTFERATSVAVDAEAVVVGDDLGVHVFTTSDGSLVQTLRPPGTAYGPMPVALDGGVLVSSLGGEILVFERDLGSFALTGTLALGASDVQASTLALRGTALVAGIEGRHDSLGGMEIPGGAYATMDWSTGVIEPLATDAAPSVGASVATNGVSAAVGARWEADGGPGRGRAHLFTRGAASWDGEVVIAPDSADYDELGASLAWEGEELFVGVPRADIVDGDSGAVYVFDTRDLTQAPLMLLPEDGRGHGAEMGRSLAVDGDRLVVGAPGEGRAGAVYVFQRRDAGGWGRVGRIEAPASVGDEGYFGRAVDVTGDRLAVLARAPDFSLSPGDALAVYTLSPVACIGTATAPPACIPPVLPTDDGGADRDACVPDCTHAPGMCREDDGCGGTCDSCPTGAFCRDSVCVRPPGLEDDGCGCVAAGARRAPRSRAWLLALGACAMVVLRRRRRG